MNKPFYEETEKDRSDLVKFMIYFEKLNLFVHNEHKLFTEHTQLE